MAFVSVYMLAIYYIKVQTIFITKVISIVSKKINQVTV